MSISNKIVQYHQLIVSAVNNKPLYMLIMYLINIPVSILAVAISSLPMVVLIMCCENNSIVNEYFYEMYVVHYVISYTLLITIWCYFLFIVYRWHYIKIRHGTILTPIYSTISLIIISVLVFTVIIYITQGITRSGAFTNFIVVQKDAYMTIAWDPILVLATIPTFDSIFNSFYLSFSTITLTGLSESKGHMLIGKLILLMGSIVGMLLVGVVLGGVSGQLFESRNK